MPLNNSYLVDSRQSSTNARIKTPINAIAHSKPKAAIEYKKKLIIASIFATA